MELVFWKEFKHISILRQEANIHKLEKGCVRLLRLVWAYAPQLIKHEGGYDARYFANNGAIISKKLEDA